MASTMISVALFIIPGNFSPSHCPSFLELSPTLSSSPVVLFTVLNIPNIAVLIFVSACANAPLSPVKPSTPPSPCKNCIFIPSSAPPRSLSMVLNMLEPLCTPSIFRLVPNCLLISAILFLLCSNCAIALAMLCACALPALASANIRSFSA